jgi:hypothetical protein
VLEASTPPAHAQVESFEVEDAPGGTRVRWTLAIEPRLPQRLAAPLAPLLMRRLFEARHAQPRRPARSSAPAPAPARLDVDRWTTRLNPLVAGCARRCTACSRRRADADHRDRPAADGATRSRSATSATATCCTCWSRRRAASSGGATTASQARGVQLRGERRRGTAHVVAVEVSLFRDVVAATLRLRRCS